MKTETRLYDDGTEPDVIRRWCCDGRCNQGRDCPGQAPAPAEACTDVGAEEPEGVELLGTAIILGALVVVIIGTLAFLAGYLL